MDKAMRQIDDLVIVSRKIEYFFPQQIKDYFLSSGESTQRVLNDLRVTILERCPDTWTGLIARIMSSFDLVSVICFVLTEQPTGAPHWNKRHRVTFYDKRRHKMAYRMKLVEEEFKTGKGDVLSRAYKAYKDYYEASSEAEQKARFLTQDEYFKERYKDVVAWYSDKNANLVGYPFIRQLSYAQRADFLLHDIYFHTYDIIRRDFSHDLAGGVDRYPGNLSGGLFSYTSGSDAVKYDIDDSHISVYTRNRFGGQDIVRHVQSVDGDFSEYSGSVEKQNELVDRLLSENLLPMDVERLDTVDQKLFRRMYSMVRLGDDSPIRIRVTSLAKMIGKEPKEREYRDVLNRVHKISTARIQRVALDETSVTYSAPEFFSVEYEIRHPDPGLVGAGEGKEHVSLIPGSEYRSVVDVIEEMNKAVGEGRAQYKCADVTLVFKPTDATKNLLMDGLNQLYLSSVYDEELSARTQAVNLLLMARRLELFREKGGDGRAADMLTYDYFVEGLRLETPRKRRLESLLEKHFGILAGKPGGVLKSFVFEKRTSRILLEYNPFSPAEYEAYAFAASSNEGHYH